MCTLIILDLHDSYVSLFPDLLCNIGLSVSGLRKMRFNTYTPRRISTKRQFPKKPGFPLSTLIILYWYDSYVSLFPDVLRNIGMSVSGLRKMRLNAYTPLRISTKNPFPKKAGFPLSTLIILDLYDSYVSLFPDLLCNIGLSVSGLRKMRLNAYTPSRISTKNQFPKKPGFPLSTLIILYLYDSYVSLFPDVLCNIGLSVSGLRKIRFNAYTLRRISTKKRISSQRNQDSHCPR